MKKSSTFISIEESERSNAKLVIALCIGTLMIMSMAAWVGFKAGSNWHMQVTDSELKALHIASDKQASRFGE